MATTKAESTETRATSESTPSVKEVQAEANKGQLSANALSPDASAAKTQKEIKSRVDKENEQGFRGFPVDPTPNENYTLAGVTSPDKHVPEEFKIQTGTVKFPEVDERAQK